MAQLSSQFASISPGMTTEEAQTGLVSLIKAWDIDVKDVERSLMDNINTLGNKFALTNKDIIEGMERAGATLSVIGTSVQDSFALFTGAQEVIQNAESVGTALKTLSLRIRGYDEETEELSDDVIAATGKVADLTKVSSNNFAGVSLWADAAQTQYRSLKDYLGDIAKIWDEIDAGDQTKLLENLFGKRGASVGSSILQNFDQVERALTEMENAAGSADAEMEVIRSSWDYKLNALKETWVGIFQSLIDRGTAGDVIDFLTSVSTLLGKIANISGLDGLVSLVANIGTQAFLKKKLDINLADFITLDNAKKVGSGIWKFITEGFEDNRKDYQKAVDSVFEETFEDIPEIIQDGLDNTEPADMSVLFEAVDGRQDFLDMINDQMVEMSENIGQVSQDVSTSIGQNLSDLEFLGEDIGDLEIESPFEVLEDNAEQLEAIRDYIDDITASEESNTTATTQNSTAQDSNTASRENNNRISQMQTAATDGHILALVQEKAAAMGYSATEQDLILQKVRELGITEASTVAELQNAAARVSGTNAISMQTKAILEQMAAEKAASSIGTKFVNLLKGGLKQLAIQAAFMLATKLLGKLVDKIKEAIKSEKELAEASKKSTAAIKEANDAFKNQKTTIEEVKKEYAELAQGVDGLGTAFQKNGSLSTEDYEKFVKYNQQLADLFPELITGTDEEGTYILNLKGNIDSINNSLETLLENYRNINQQTILDNVGSIWKEAKKKVKKYVPLAADARVNEESASESLKRFLNSERNSRVWKFQSPELYSDLQKAFKELKIQNEKALLPGGPLGESGIDLSQLSATEYQRLKDYFTNNLKNYQTEAAKYEKEVEISNQKVATALKGYFENDNDFVKLPKVLQDTALSIFNSFDMDNLPNGYNANDGFEGLTEWYQDNIVNALQQVKSQNIQKAMADVFAGGLDVNSLRENINTIIEYLTKPTSEGGLGLTADNELVITFTTKLDDLDTKRDRVFEKLFGKTGGRGGAKKREFLENTYGSLIDEFTDAEWEQILGSDLDFSVFYKNTNYVVKQLHDYLNKEVKSQEPISLSDWLSATAEKDASGNSKTRQDLINDYYSTLSTVSDLRDKITSGEEITAGDILGELPDIQPYLDDYNTFSEAIDHYILDKYKELKEKNGDMSLVQGAADFWSKVSSETTNALNNRNLSPTFNPQATVSDAVQAYEQNTELWLKSLSDSYDKLFDGKKFNYMAVDKDTIAGIKKDFKNLENSLHIDVPDEEMDKLIRVLTNSKTTTEQAQKAFDEYATTLFNTASGLKAINEENAEYMKKLFKDNGLNADDAVDEYVQYQKELAVQVERQKELYEEQESAKKQQVTLNQELVGANDAERQSIEGKLVAIDQEIAARQGEMEAAEDAALELARLQAIEAGIDLNNIDSSGDVAAILAIAKACGVAVKSYSVLTSALGEGSKADAFKNSTAYTQMMSMNPEAAKKQLERYAEADKKRWQKAVDELFNSNNHEVDMSKVHVVGGGSSSGGGGGSSKDAAEKEGEDAGQAYVDAYNKELEALKWMKDQGLITEAEYLEKFRELYQRYYGDLSKYAKEYYEAEREYLEQKVALQQKAINAAIKILDNQIKKQERLRDAEKKEYEEAKKANEKKIKQLEKIIKTKDKEIKQLQKEQKLIRKQNIEPLEEMIKARQKIVDQMNEEIEAIEKANEARQDEINLQKMAYELERSMHQRTSLVNIYANPCSNAWI